MSMSMSLLLLLAMEIPDKKIASLPTPRIEVERCRRRSGLPAVEGRCCGRLEKGDAAGSREQGFFYRPKVVDIFEISFLSLGSDKI
jgi:hypothetical protein